MIEIFFAVAIFLGVGGLFARDHYIASKRRKTEEEEKKERERELFLQELEKYGSTRDKQRVWAIRELDKEVRLRLIECRHISKILDNEHIRDKLESAAVNVEELKLLLSNDDDLTEKFRKLESDIDNLKLLGD